MPVGRALHLGAHVPGGPARRRPGPARLRAASTAASGGGGAKAATSGLLKSALTCGGLSLAGDILAQLLTIQLKKDSGQRFDPVRAARMAGFGLLFYGPYQHFWYPALDARFPGRSTPNFAAKVALNQLALAPVVLTAVFAWNTALVGNGAAFPGKVRRDLWPTMVNGWKFWVPAASINFYAIPLHHQVLYMSTCGLLWTAYLSYSSNTETGTKAVRA